MFRSYNGYLTAYKIDHFQLKIENVRIFQNLITVENF